MLGDAAEDVWGDWHLLRLRRDPWLVATGQDTDPHYERTLKHRKRAPRPRALHERVPVPRYLRGRAARSLLALAGQRPVRLVRATTPPPQPG